MIWHSLSSKISSLLKLGEYTENSISVELFDCTPKRNEMRGKIAIS